MSALGLSACLDGSGSGPSTGIGSACGSQLCLDLTAPANAPLRTTGGSVLVDWTNGRTLLLARTSPTDVIALSAICTHEGCLVDFDSTQNLIVCPCHGSEFAESGAVVRGPARTPLVSYPTALSGDQLVVG